MKKATILTLSFAFLLLVGCQNKSFHYPITKKTDQVDEYFGTKVSDPYRWLENDTSAQTEEWVKAQNKVTFDYIKNIPSRKDIEARLTKIWNYPKTSAPFKKGGYYFEYRNTGLQNQSVIYIKKSLEWYCIINKLPSIRRWKICCIRYLSREFFVREIETGKNLEDHIMWAKFSSISWYKDGFFYSRYPEPKEGDALKGVNTNSKVYYHKIGDKQSDDKMIYEEPKNPQRGFNAYVTDDNKYLIIGVTESTSGNAVYFKNLKKRNSKVVKLVTTFDNDYSIIDHINGKFIVLTNLDAPKYRVVTINPRHPEKENWEELIPEKENVLSSISTVGHKIIANYMKDAHTVIEIYNLKGQYENTLDIPVGSAGGFDGKIDDNITFFTFSSFNTPSTIYKYNIEENKISLYHKSEIDFNTDEYVTKQIFYKSKDGTKVPMFITHKKGLKLDGNNPTLLYAYGGFNISLTPYFRTSILPWLENNGVFAVANIRGGGEYGEEWHKAGTLMQKQNVFDDFISAAEYLIKEKYTSSKKLAIQGGSNGGLLIGAVTNQRPDLFAVALPAVGVMDMLRYHKFTIGRYWATDYGTSEDSKEIFEYLYHYSPLHNIKTDVEYPAVLVTTADHDDRVVPAHSFKYIATLQEKYKGNNPVMIRIETKAGHGAGTPTSKAIEQAADMLSFTWNNMGITPVFK